MSQSVKPLIASVGAALALGSAMPANAADNPFASVELSSGYEVAAQKEGNCGGHQKSEEAKDKAKSKAEHKMMEEGKCGEGKCGEAMMAEKAKQAKEKKDKEGKCGEGKCGAA